MFLPHSEASGLGSTLKMSGSAHVPAILHFEHTGTHGKSGMATNFFEQMHCIGIVHLCPEIQPCNRQVVPVLAARRLTAGRKRLPAIRAHVQMVSHLTPQYPKFIQLSNHSDSSFPHTRHETRNHNHKHAYATSSHTRDIVFRAGKTTTRTRQREQQFDSSRFRYQGTRCSPLSYPGTLLGWSCDTHQPLIIRVNPVRVKPENVFYEILVKEICLTFPRQRMRVRNRIVAQRVEHVVTGFIETETWG